MHALEQETAAQLQTSQRLLRQRANLAATLDVLRTMDGVAQVCCTAALLRRCSLVVLLACLKGSVGGRATLESSSNVRSCPTGAWLPAWASSLSSLLHRVVFMGSRSSPFPRCILPAENPPVPSPFSTVCLVAAACRRRARCRGCCPAQAVWLPTMAGQ